MWMTCDHNYHRLIDEEEGQGCRMQHRWPSGWQGCCPKVCNNRSLRRSGKQWRKVSSIHSFQSETHMRDDVSLFFLCFVMYHEFLILLFLSCDVCAVRISHQVRRAGDLIVSVRFFRRCFRLMLPPAWVTSASRTPLLLYFFALLLISWFAALM